FLFALITGLTICSFAEAKVTFISESDNDAGASYIADPNLKNPIKYTTGEKCTAKGYVLTKCPSGYFLTGRFPQDGNYYKECCSDEYAFTSEDCVRAGLRPSVTKCGGLHRCI
ncbi:MAG: hypothetical protein LBL47_04295, partial [Lactobacillus sp.]|nr:hypothetical protein [Lactobacillus sp.]